MAVPNVLTIYNEDLTNFEQAFLQIHEAFINLEMPEVQRRKNTMHIRDSVLKVAQKVASKRAEADGEWSSKNSTQLWLMNFYVKEVGGSFFGQCVNAEAKKRNVSIRVERQLNERAFQFLKHVSLECLYVAILLNGRRSVRHWRSVGKHDKLPLAVFGATFGQFAKDHGIKLEHALKDDAVYEALDPLYKKFKKEGVSFLELSQALETYLKLAKKN